MIKTKYRKLQRLLSLFLTLVMCLGLLPMANITVFAGSAVFDENDYKWFNFNDEGTSIISTNLGRPGAPTQIVIPRYGLKRDGTRGGEITDIAANAFSGKSLTKIEFESGSKITNIGNQAFYNNSITEIELPTGITHIRDNAFGACKSLRKVNLAELQNLSYIGSSAFQNCALQSIDLPTAGNLKTIGKEAFLGCYQTTAQSVTIPAGVTSIGQYAFDTNNNVGASQKFTVKLPHHAPGSLANAPWATYYSMRQRSVEWSASNNPDIDTTSDSCWIYNKKTKEVIGLKADASTKVPAYPDFDKATGVVTVPAAIGGNPVTGIADGAFQAWGRGLSKSSGGTVGVKGVTFAPNPDFVRIGVSAFAGNGDITSITNIPDSTTTIAAYAMGHLGGLTEITLSKKLETVGSLVFGNDMRLKKVIFPAEYGTAPNLKIAGDVFSYTKETLTDIYLEGYDAGSIEQAPWSARYAKIHYHGGEQPPVAQEGEDRYGNKWMVDTGYQSGSNKNRIIAYRGSTNADPTMPKLDTDGWFHIPGELYVNGSWVSVNVIQTMQLAGNQDAYNLKNKGITKVKLDPNVYSIENWVCYNLGLEEVDLGEVKSIGAWTFQYNNLTKLTLPESVVSIGTLAFGNNKLTEPLYIPRNVTQIASNAFSIVESVNNEEIQKPNGITEVYIDQYFNNESDGQYVKAPSGVRQNAPFGTGAGVNVIWQDTMRPDPTHELFSDAWDYKNNKAIDAADNTATLLIHGYTNDNFAVVRSITYEGNDIHVGEYPTRNGMSFPAEGRIMGIDKNGTYNIQVSSIRLDELADFSLTNPPETQRTITYNVEVDAFHKVTYDLTDLSNYPGVSSISGTAIDPRGDLGYVRGYAVEAADGSYTIQSTTGNYSLEGWRDKDNPKVTVGKGATIIMPDRDMVLIPVLRETSGDDVEVVFNGNGGVVSFLDTENPTMSIKAGQLLKQAQNYDKMIISRPGYRFIGWSTTKPADPEEKIDVNIISYPNGTGITKLDVYAVWEKIDGIVVTFDGNGGDFGNNTFTAKIGPGTYGETLGAPDVSRNGYKFEEWNTESDGSGEPIAINGMTYPLESTVYYAQWLPLKQDIKFSCGENGKFEDNDTEKTYRIDTDDMISDILKNVPVITPDEGWTFDGWSDGKSLYKTEEIGSIIVPAGGITFTAQYTQKGKTAIYYDFDGGKSGSDTFKKWEDIAGTSFTENLPDNVIKTGYTLTPPNKPDKFPEEGVTVIKAVWTANVYTIRFDSNGGAGTMSDMQNVEYDTEMTLKTNEFSKGGSEFKGWTTIPGGTVAEYVDGARIKNLTAENNETVTLYAVWGTNDVTVIFDANGGLWADNNAAVKLMTAKAGTNLTAPDDPTREGYEFDGWDKPVPSVFPDADDTYNAKWKEKNYAYSYIVTAPEDGITVGVAPTGSNADFGSDITLAEAPEVSGGYTFIGWKAETIPATAAGAISGIYADGSTVKMPNGNVVFTAWFAEPAGAVIIFDYNGGKVGDDTSSYLQGKKGDSVVVPVPERKGYVFVDWNPSIPAGTEVTFGNPGTVVKYTAQWREKESGNGKYISSSTQYTLTYNTNGGSVIASTKHKNSTIVNLTETSTRENYIFMGWYADKELTKKITSITMNGNKTVYAGWKEVEKPDTSRYIDIADTRWSKDDIDYVSETGLMVGINDKEFGPTIPTTRGMIVTVLYRLEGKPAATEANPFSDVKAGSYYEDAIIWAAENDIVAGYGEGKFGPDDDITREQLAAILYRYAAFKSLDTFKTVSLGGYKDVDKASAYAVPALQWAVAENLLVGDNGNLNPRNKATREQVAAVVHRFCENVVK